MAGVAMGMLWAAYALGLFAYCLFKGYNVTPGEMLSSTWPPVVGATK